MVSLTDLTNGPKMFQETFGSKWGPRLWRAVFTIVVVAIVTGAMSQIFGSWHAAYLEVAGWFSPSTSSPPGRSQTPVNGPSNPPATPATPPPSTPSTPPVIQPPPTLSREEKDARIAVWKLVVQRMDELASLLNQGDAMLDTWHRDIQVNRAEEIKKTQDFAADAYKFRLKLESTHHSIIGSYSDIADVLKVAVRPPGAEGAPGSIFAQFVRSANDFSEGLNSSTDFDPKNLQIGITPIAQIFRKNLSTVRTWEQEIKRTGEDQISSLSH
jgi:hypothetical protein